MDAIEAASQSNALIANMMSQLTPEHREMQTPCKNWTSHDLIEHMVAGALSVADLVEGREPSDAEVDHLAQGPVAGWTGALARLDAAATPQNMAAIRQSPFGEQPGEMILSVIVADHLVHAWDLSRATGIAHEISDELAEFAMALWSSALPEQARNGNTFDVIQPCADDASSMDKVAAFTGRVV